MNPDDYSTFEKFQKAYIEKYKPMFESDLGK